MSGYLSGLRGQVWLEMGGLKGLSNKNQLHSTPTPMQLLYAG